MSPRRRKILKITAYVAASISALVIVLLIGFRIALAYAPGYRDQVREWVSDRTRLAIDFTRMDARLRFYGPELVFDDAIVRSRDGKRTLVRAHRVSVAFDFWTALGTGRLAAGRVTLEEPELQAVRTRDGRYQFVGQDELPERDRAEPVEPDSLPTGRLHVVDARVGFRDLKTGRGPWVVPGVSFDLNRSGSAMHLEGEAALPGPLGKSLRFNGDSEGKLAEAGDLEWRFMIAAEDLDLAGWAQVMPNDWPAPKKGRGSFNLSGALRGARPNDITMHTEFRDVVLTLPAWSIALPAAPIMDYRDDDSDEPEPQTEQPSTESQELPSSIDYSRVAFDLRVRREESQQQTTWNIALENLELSRRQRPWQSKAIAVSLARSESGALDIAVKSDVVVLDNLWPLLAYAPESSRLAQVRAADAHGRIQDIEGRFWRAESEAPPKYSVRGRFVDLEVSPIAKLPGIERFSGAFVAGEDGGQVELNVVEGALALPRFFRAPLPANRITGRMSWRKEQNAWRITGESVHIESPDGRAEARGSVLVPSNGDSPTVDLYAEGFDLDARAAPRYLPAGRLPPTALAWLDRAFTAGRVPRAKFEMRGPTRAFPYRNNEGLFLIEAQVEGLTLDYQPGWTPATNLQVAAEFRNAGMTAKLQSGEVHGLEIKSATGRFVDFKRSELLLDAEIRGDLGSSLTYLQESPIGPVIGSQFMALRGQGAIEASARISLPFANIDARKVSVNTRLQNTTIALEGIEQPATAVVGELAVQDYIVKSLSLQGLFLGGRFYAKGGATERYYGRGAGMDLTASGSAHAAELARLLHLPSAVGLEGGMNWQLHGLQPRHDPDGPTPRSARVDSDTKGLRIALPAPIGKETDTTRALRFELDAPNDSELLLHGSFGDARTFVRVAKTGDEWRFDRGALRLDAQPAALPAHAGLRIEGSIDSFVLDDWLKLKGDGEGKGQLSDYLRAANVRVHSFGFLGYAWSDVRTLLQAGDDSWRVDLAGDDVTGQLTIPYIIGGSKPLQLSLAKLDIGDRSQSKSSGTGADADPKDLPAIAGRVDELSLSGRPVGSARFTLEKNAQGVRLVGGELRGPSFTATAQGSWLGAAGSSKSMVTIDVASTDVRETLRAFNFHDVISGKRANGHAELTWSGGIDENLLSRASGSVQIEVADGQLLDVEPGGPARMLGLMSIAALPRRLALDFGDVTDKGFRFDIAKADFELRQGDAYTNNLLLRGPAAEVGIVGRTGLSKRDYDLTAAAAGDIGGSLSVAGTVVGGPVIGAAVLAFTRLFKEPLKGVTRRYYKIEGSWDNPHIERIDRQEAKQETNNAQTASPEAGR